MCCIFCPTQINDTYLFKALILLLNKWGISGTVVAHWTAGQQVERAILHQGQDSLIIVQAENKSILFYIPYICQFSDRIHHCAGPVPPVLSGEPGTALCPAGIPRCAYVLRPSTVRGDGAAQYYNPPQPHVRAEYYSG